MIIEMIYKFKFARFGFKVPRFKCKLFYRDLSDIVIGQVECNSFFWDGINGKCFSLYSNIRKSEYDLCPLDKG